MTLSVGMRSLSVCFPGEIRTNAYFQERHPQAVSDAEQRTLARLWRPDTGRPPLLFDELAAPYLIDPFRGTVERRVCRRPMAATGEHGGPAHPSDGGPSHLAASDHAPSEDAFSLELKAAREALRGAGITGEDVDLLISCSFRASHIGVGNAAFLARALELGGTAWNLETACASAVTAFHVAAGLVRAGMHRRVLVTVSCTYSLDTDEPDTLSWFMGDGAGAFVVAEVPQGEGYLGGAFAHTGATCGTFEYRPMVDPESGDVVMRIGAAADTGRVLRETSAHFVERCCHAALKDAEVSLEEIGCFVFNTPTAWFASFAAAVLGLRAERAVNTNPLYANIGPALTTANLHYAARTGMLKPGDLGLIYAIGSVSSAGAVVVRWGDVAMGADPPHVYDRKLPDPFGSGS